MFCTQALESYFEGSDRDRDRLGAARAPLLREPDPLRRVQALQADGQRGPEPPRRRVPRRRGGRREPRHVPEPPAAARLHRRADRRGRPELGRARRLQGGEPEHDARLPPSPGRRPQRGRGRAPGRWAPIRTRRPSPGRSSARCGSPAAGGPPSPRPRRRRRGSGARCYARYVEQLTAAVETVGAGGRLGASEIAAISVPGVPLSEPMLARLAALLPRGATARDPEARDGAHAGAARVPHPGHRGPAPPGRGAPEPDAPAGGPRGAHRGPAPRAGPLPRPEAERRQPDRCARHDRAGRAGQRGTQRRPHRAARAPDARAGLGRRAAAVARAAGSSSRRRSPARR